MTPLPLIQGSALTNTLAVYYRVPTTDPKVKSIRLNSVRVVNTDVVTRLVTVHVVPAGATASVGTTKLNDYPVQAGGSLLFDMDDVMLHGTTIQASADAANVVALSATGIAFP